MDPTPSRLVEIFGIWGEFSTLNEPSEAQVVSVLCSVANPTSGNAAIRPDMVSGISHHEGHVIVSLDIPADQAAALEPVRAAAETAVAAMPGVEKATVVMTAERKGGDPTGGSPVSSPAPPPSAGPRPVGGGRSPGGRRIEVPDVKAIIAVASGKGGVGKSTMAINLALGLTANGLSVGLLDADIYGPSMPRMTGLSGKPSTPDGQTLDPMQAHGLKVMSIGFLVDEETPMIWRGPMVQSALTQMLRDVNWGSLDVLVVDMPPGTGDAQLTMAQQVPLAGAVIVSTPQDIALLDARKGLNMFRRVDVPVLGIIENMSYFLGPHGGERSDVFSTGGARRESERLGVDFLGEVPLHMDIRETSDGGTPITALRPDGAHARAFRDIAAAVWDRLSGTPARQPPRIVIV